MNCLCKGSDSNGRLLTINQAPVPIGVEILLLLKTLKNCAIVWIWTRDFQFLFNDDMISDSNERLLTINQVLVPIGVEILLLFIML